MLERTKKTETMVKRTSFAGDTCPVARALDVIGDWWSLLIIRDALIGLTRFEEFQAKLAQLLDDRFGQHITPLCLLKILSAAHVLVRKVERR